MVGGPSQLDLFDYKPGMNEWYDKDLPESVRKRSSAFDGDDFWAGPVSDCALEVWIHAAGQVRNVDERSAVQS